MKNLIVLIFMIATMLTMYPTEGNKKLSKIVYCDKIATVEGCAE